MQSITNDDLLNTQFWEQTILEKPVFEGIKANILKNYALQLFLLNLNQRQQKTTHICLNLDSISQSSVLSHIETSTTKAPKANRVISVAGDERVISKGGSCKEYGELNYGIDSLGAQFNMSYEEAKDKLFGYSGDLDRIIKCLSNDKHQEWNVCEDRNLIQLLQKRTRSDILSRADFLELKDIKS